MTFGRSTQRLYPSASTGSLKQYDWPVTGSNLTSRSPPLADSSSIDLFARLSHSSDRDANGLGDRH